MREIDIYTYPRIFVEANRADNDVKTQITVELKEEMRQRVLELIFGNSNLEILNR
jgi:hypothetical protein